MTPFTWKNCVADVYAVQHGRVARSYQTDVIDPAIAALNAKIEELGRSTEGWAPFAKRDTEDLADETLRAFALAVQSLWERQLRGYVRGCAEEQHLATVASDALAPNWVKVERAFEQSRGIALGAFPSYAVLGALHLIGNVCRHGDGPSVARLHAVRPDYWPNLVIPPLDGPGLRLPPSAQLMKLRLEHLREFTDAIAEFWEDASYIYLESLETKHDNVVSRLRVLRAEGQWLPQASGDGGGNA